MERLKASIYVPDTSLFSIKKSLMTPERHKIHAHSNYELNYILNGWGNRIVGDSIESFSRGDLVLIGPDLPHCWEVQGVSEGMEPECITIHFRVDFLGELFIQLPELRPMYDLVQGATLGLQFYGDEIVDINSILIKMLETNPFRSVFA